MSQNPCAKPHKVRPALLRLSFVGILLLTGMALFGSTGCEDKAIGRPCSVLTDAGNAQGVYNSEALECPSRICLKPVVQAGATMPDPPTTAYCSASCSQDSDCDGQSRDNVEHMKSLAVAGPGLNSYINTHVKHRYASQR